MASITLKMLENRVAALNRMYGFKGRKYVKYKSKKGYKLTGSGFGLDQSYGRVALVFESKGNSGHSRISDSMTKAQLYEFIRGMNEGVRYWKIRASKR